jgi:TonB family protein
MMPLLAEAALRSLALGALVWIALLMIRPRNPHVQKTIWITVLVASIAMPFVLRWQITPQFDVPEYVLTIPNFDSVYAARAVNGTAPPPLASFTARAVTLIYVAGALALLARFALGLLKIVRIRRRATLLDSASGSREDIRISADILSPATFGSTILLPSTMTAWTDSMLGIVLSHERAHVRHKDCYVQWLARLHTCVFWFNPLSWWLQRHLADLAETTSDDAVLEGTLDRVAYADLLLEIARHPPAGRVVMSAARPSISARIERIISNTPPALPPRRWVRAAVIALLIPPIAMAAATLQTTQPSPQRSSSQQAAMAAATASTAQTNAEDDAFPEWKSGLPTPLKIVDWGDMGELEDYYPQPAKIAGREGEVIVGLIVGSNGLVTDTQLLRVSPANDTWGFGLAAEAVTRTLVFENPTGATTKMKIKVKFALKKEARNINVPTPDESWTTTYSKD